ncbi:MAG: glucuronate isomerase [Kiritimatiellia bacterium]
MGKDVYITEEFLLENKAARRLYHEYAEGMPIVDYHCHLPPADIAGDRSYSNMSELWLHGDHYKWRAMRSNGVPEKYCTGDSSDREKFQKWAETVPYLLRNQLYNWTHLELKRYFGISDRLLNGETAAEIWQDCNAKLADPAYSCRGLLRQCNVRLVCTTDDPVDGLEEHAKIREDDSCDIKVLPAWRPDRGMAVEDPEKFNEWINRLEKAAGLDIDSFSSYLEALRRRHAFFDEAGCRVSDHGIETVYAEDYDDAEIRLAFEHVRMGRTLSAEEILKFKSAMLYEFGLMDAESGWVQQFHLGAMRNNNTRMFEALGPDSGFDSIGDFEIGRPLARLLDRLNSAGKLAKTILYNLNPRDNALLVTMMGNFQDGTVAGKMQYGSAWWFLDQKDGMERQLEDLSQTGLLSRFAGMLTDSRSFLSFTRHEYFRRILCNMLGRDMEKGFIPEDYKLAGNMVKDISFRNAIRYFGFDLPPQ